MTLRIDCHRLQSLPPISLINTCSNALQAYFKNSWELYDCLFLSIQEGCAYYQQPDPLRNPLIFYLGHTAVFYINKLKLAGLIKKGINAEYEKIFSVGVDPENPEDLFNNNVRWPEEDKVWKYRVQAYELISQLINNIKLPNSINQEDPLWSLFMGIEHERIHFETSSVLIRQCSTKFLKQPHSWVIAPFEGRWSPLKIFYMSQKGK